MEYDSRTERLPADQQVCALVQDLLPLYIEGEVSGQSRAMIVAHLNECAHCAGFLRGARSARAQFERERERAGQGNQSTYNRLVVTVLRQMVGAMSFVVCVILGILALVDVFIATRFPSWLVPMNGGGIHALYVVFCLLALAVLARQLLQRELKQNSLAVVVSFAGTIMWLVGGQLPYYEINYAILGGALLVASLTYLWTQRHAISHLNWREAVVGSGQLLLASIGCVVMIQFFRPEMPVFLSNTIEVMPTSHALPTLTAVWTPTPVASFGYPAPVMGLPAPTPTITPTPTVTPTPVAQP